MSASDEFFFKLNVAALYDDLKNTPGFPPSDPEVERTVTEMLQGDLKELGAACGFELDEETLREWIAASQQLNY